MRQSGAARAAVRNVGAGTLPPWRAMLAVGFLALATNSNAQYRPRSSAGLVSADTVHEAVGIPKVDVACPDQHLESMSDLLNPSGPHMARGAKITLEKAGDGYRDTAITDTLLWGGLVAAIQQCPMQIVNIAGQQSPQEEVGFVDIYGKLTDDGPEIRLVHGDNFIPSAGEWSHITDEGALEEKRVADAKADEDRQAQEAEQAKQQAAQAQAMASQQAANAQAEAAAETSRKRTGGVFWFWVQMLFLGGIGLWLYTKREPILRFFYGLTPHPAGSEITAVIEWGKSYDPDRLRELLDYTPSDPIEREVRLRQAAELARRLNQHSAETKAEIEANVEYLKSKNNLTESMAIHESIKRRLELILRARGGTA
jgi:hypothetical protein